MKLERAIQIAEEKGYEVEAKEFVKNGVVKKGLVIKQGMVAPVIYYEDIAEEDFAYVLENRNPPEIDFNVFTNPANLRIFMQRPSSEDLVRVDAPFGLDVEAYVGLDVGTGTTKLTSESVANLFGDADIKAIAIQNTIAKAVVNDFYPGMLILSNSGNFKGASAVFAKSLIKEEMENRGWETAVLIPSSIHEFLLLPFADGDKIEQYEKMLSGINNDKRIIDDEDILSYKPVVITKADC